jgi:hypothetical protein
MLSTIRRKLDTGGRVHVYCGAHPYANERYNATVAELGTELDQAQLLAAKVLDGEAAADAAVQEKEKLTDQLREQLGHMARIAVSSEEAAPAMVAQFRTPKPNANTQALLSEARAVAGRAGEHKALFVAAGLPEGFLDDLNALIAALEAAIDARRAGRSAHVEARAELKGRTDRVMQLVKTLDALQRYRFRLSPAERRAWLSARNVEWPVKEPVAGGQADGGAGGQPRAGEGGAGTTR